MINIVPRNRKGAVTAGLILTIALAIVLLIVLSSGGALTAFKVGQFVASVPVWVWVVIILAFLFRGRGGKRRR